MRSIARLLSRSVHVQGRKNTERQLIGFRSRKDFEHSIRLLKRSGKRPVKSLPDSGILCCHLDKRLGAKLLADHPGIRFVEKDIKARAHIHSAYAPKIRKAPGRGANPANKSQASVPWNINRVHAPSLWLKTRGKGIRLAVVDTGIAKHPDLNVAGGINTINGGSFRDDNGHGTHVAGIAAATGNGGRIAGTAPAVKLYAVKVLNRDGEGYVSDIVEGIDWCIRNGIHVINLSLGIGPGSDSTALHDAIKRARRKGVVIVASAGNSGKGSRGLDAPASYPETIAVAASTRGDRIASFSSRGQGIGITAPGDNIRSTWLNNGYRLLSGTSMSSPHAAGGASLLLALRPQLSPASIAGTIRRTARKLTGATSAEQGPGLLRLSKAAAARAAKRGIRG
jgi:minor extracellular protease Epr